MLPSVHRRLSRPNNNQIRGPATLDRGSVTAWLGRMRAMRDACQPAIGFNASVYDEPGLQWVSTISTRAPAY